MPASGSYFGCSPVASSTSCLLAVAAKMAPKEIQQSYIYLVSLAVRLLVATTIRSGGVAEPLAIAARDTYESKIATAADLLDQVRTITPSDAWFREGFPRAKSSTAKLARYYLRSLERAAKNEAHPEFIPEDDRSIITLEHVLPLNPETNWPGFSEDDVRAYAKRLGNLVLPGRGTTRTLRTPTSRTRMLSTQGPATNSRARWRGRTSGHPRPSRSDKTLSPNSTTKTWLAK